jgi:TM2 domain-containing membrane protein YozV
MVNSCCPNCGFILKEVKTGTCPKCGIKARAPENPLLSLSTGRVPLFPALLSFALPGSGQLYNEEYKKSFIFFIIAIILGLSIFLLIGLLLYPAFGIYAAYDAYKGAQKKEKDGLT